MYTGEKLASRAKGFPEEKKCRINFRAATDLETEKKLKKKKWKNLKKIMRPKKKR